MKRESRSSLLFEIGVEEIPAGYFAAAEASILAKAPALLAECGWQFGHLSIASTPRRLVIHAEDFRPLVIQEEEKLGPMKDQAYQDGKPTPALIGFLKSVNLNESDSFLKQTQRGERVCVKVRKERKPLRHFFETLPTQIEFPKMMRWEEGRFSFTRPIRWTFAFVGNQLQKYKIAGVLSAPFTYGHRFLSPGKIKVTNSDFKTFQKLLAKYHVLLNAEGRIQKIKTFLKPFNNHNEELIRIVAYLVEEPFPVQGSFLESYLKLPEGVLTTCMSKNQKIFACYDSNGKLRNHFLAVINGPRKNIKQIAKNYESVLTSRLKDAQFFFDEDRKTSLESKVAKLKEMIFLGSLGSYYDKTKRLEHLVEFLGREATCSAEVIHCAKRAAHLAKADLTAHLVYEFPELQGTAGFEYARLEGEEKSTAEAIRGHYLPSNLSEDFRELKKRVNLEGALVGLCDRLDLLVGAAGLGIELSGSQDPYALRRAAGGIVKLLRAHPLKCSLSRWIHSAYEQYGKLISKPEREIVSQLTPFFRERIIFELQLKAGSKELELLQGIFASGFDDIANIYQRFDQLVKEINHPSFIQACKVMERTGNILKSVKEKINDHIEPSLFQDALEHRLFELLQQEQASMNKLVSEKRYGAAVRRYGDIFYRPVHDFFDRVLVNAEDAKIRMNRQSLVRKINALCANQIADLSYVTNLDIPEAQETKV